MSDEILEVLKGIRDEAKQTNVRLAAVEEHLASVDEQAKQTNARLQSLDSRVEFVEKRTSRAIDGLSERLEEHVQRVELLARQQAQNEIRLATEVLSLADVTRDVRDLLARKLDDHHLVLQHEERIRVLETRLSGHDPS